MMARTLIRRMLKGTGTFDSAQWWRRRGALLAAFFLVYAGVALAAEHGLGAAVLGVCGIAVLWRRDIWILRGSPSRGGRTSPRPLTRRLMSFGAIPNGDEALVFFWRVLGGWMTALSFVAAGFALAERPGASVLIGLLYATVLLLYRDAWLCSSRKTEREVLE